VLAARPSACGTTAALPSDAISCLGAFQTPAAGAYGQISAAGVRKPAQEATYAVQQTCSLLDHLVGAGEQKCFVFQNLLL
jgi:hypothetical protein